VRRCPHCNRDLAWDEIGKGYEVSKGEYALFTKEELSKLDGEESAGTIEIVEFVDPLEVDLAYVEKSYWIGPGSKNVRGYDLLRSVLAETKKVALAKVRLRTRTRLALVRPRGRLFSLDMMRFAEELVSGDELAPAEQKTPSPREKELAQHLVDELSGPFDPARHPDEYRNAVLAAVDEKVEAGEVARDTAGEGEAAAASPATGAQVIDLAELLSRSIKAAGKPGPAKAKESSHAERSEKEEKGKVAGGGGGAKKKRATG
jgi:DNA end-binding protein Ku